MTLFFVSFIAGILTVIMPCVLPLLPVIVGSSVSDTRSRIKPYVIVGSLAVSIVLFTLLLKWSTLFIDIPESFWSWFSGGILILFGLTLLFPVLWERLPFVQKMSTSSNQLIGKGYQKKNLGGDILIGAALGPVFSSCSPTYFIILATVLPESFVTGLVYLMAYTIGLSMTLLMIALLGQRAASRLEGVANPRGWFKRSIGIVFIVVGVVIILGVDDAIQRSILDSGFLDATKIEQKILEAVN